MATASARLAVFPYRRFINVSAAARPNTIFVNWIVSVVLN